MGDQYTWVWVAVVFALVWFMGCSCIFWLNVGHNKRGGRRSGRMIYSVLLNSAAR
jgi:hypothetical protein